MVVSFPRKKQIAIVPKHSIEKVMGLIERMERYDIELYWNGASFEQNEFGNWATTRK